MAADARLALALSGRYRLGRELGAGGMATVYLAHDDRHDRPVAIKVLHADVAASVGGERFLAEIHTTAKLAHPNILPLFDSGTQDDILYYVMPLVTGESLRARLERERVIETTEALRITREVADALAYAHANGVIHRDIKPENILLQSGHALVSDFGIARAPTPSGNERLTSAGLSLGTPAYMSPEQAAADPHVDGRSDQYSLACVLFEMLTGGAPFSGPSVEAILVRRFTRPPPRASSRRADIARHLDGAIFTAMARDPNERFASLERFAEALREPSPYSAANAGDASVAVLPFANMSADPENEYFGDGMAEEIINALAQVPGLRVAARTSAFAFKGRSHDLREIGEKLNVGAVLEGSVRRAGNRVRITAQLISVSDGYQLWSERYDRELTDIFAIQDEIATAIANRLAMTLRAGTDASLVRPSTSSIEAYELYLKARSLMKERGPSLLVAIDLFEKAVALDPGFAPALAHLAQAMILSSFWGMSPPDRVIVRAKWAAATALERDPTLVAAHTASALVATCIDFDAARATEAWNRALAIDPADADARVFRAAFDLCYARGLFDEAVAELRLAIDRDPLNPVAHTQLSVILSFAGRFSEALVEAQRARELDGQSFFVTWAYVNAHTFGGDAREVVDRVPALLPRYGRHPWLMMGLTAACDRLGLTAQAESVYAELVARARNEYVQPAILASTAEHAGRRAEALEFLREAVAIRDPLLSAFALHSPPMAALRRAPEFTDILSGLSKGSTEKVNSMWTAVSG
ncbi:MAG TPA: protein kinase [Gemmatimonadaceae bacterium]|nr:protein kinase [Gemmatimonadaceae bacterium]